MRQVLSTNALFSRCNPVPAGEKRKGKEEGRMEKKNKVMCYSTGHQSASSCRTGAVTWQETTGHHQTGS